LIHSSNRLKPNATAFTFLLWLSDVCSDIATLKHEYWSALAPLPFEVVISAGQKAKEESWAKG